MSVEEVFAEAKRKQEVQRRWEDRRRYRRKREVRRRVNEIMAPEWQRVRELHAIADRAESSMKDGLAYQEAYNAAHRKEELLLAENHATFGDAIKSFLLTVERNGFVPCPSCGEYYSKLRESGICIECDPYEKPQPKKSADDQAGDILAEVEDFQKRASGE